jgi:hypothetical protein
MRYRTSKASGTFSLSFDVSFFFVVNNDDPGIELPPSDVLFIAPNTPNEKELFDGLTSEFLLLSPWCDPDVFVAPDLTFSLFPNKILLKPPLLGPDKKDDEKVFFCLSADDAFAVEAAFLLSLGRSCNFSTAAPSRSCKYEGVK